MVPLPAACSPFHLAKCKAVVLTWSLRAGLGIGLRHGSGFCIAKLPPPVCWSAPLFLKLNVAEAGFIIGAEKIDTFMVAMTDKLTSRLVEGRY